MHSEHCQPVLPRIYLQKLTLLDDAGNTKSGLSSFEDLITDLSMGLRLPPPTSLGEWLGFSAPGALLLPVSVRAPHTVYQTVGFIAYSKQLVHSTYETIVRKKPVLKRPLTTPLTPLLEHATQTADSSSSAGGESSEEEGPPSATEEPVPLVLAPNNHLKLTHIGLVDIGVPNTLRTLPLLVRGISVEHGTSSLFGNTTTPSTEAVQASASHDTAIRTIASSHDMTEGVTEEDEHLVNSPLRLGTYIVEYCDHNARSSARSTKEADLQAHYRWIDQALEVTLSAFAVLIFQSLLPSLEQGLSLGFSLSLEMFKR